LSRGHNLNPIAFQLRLKEISYIVTNFNAVDGEGRPLPWAKTTKNTWHVKTADAARVVVSYDDNIPAEADRSEIADGLRKIVTTATDLMGDIPYEHCTFLLIGKGVGGVDHLTSTAMLFDAGN
jgi:predicted metalloprotease with PDZ domain